MILFVGGGSGDVAAAERALRSVLARLPFFPGRPVESWRHPAGAACMAWVAHGPEQTGGVEYVALEAERIALFAGRPILWAASSADGRRPLDARVHLAGVPREALDGRYAVARASGDGVSASADLAGAYPLYETETGGAHWMSNSAAVLRELHGSAELNLDSLAGLLGGGWPLDGNPAWGAVRRIPLSPAPVHPGSGFHPERAAELLVAVTRALFDWPGRPQVIPLTAGRDSRLVLAAALAAGVDFEANTGGGDADPDVVTGRRLAELTGVRHSLISDEGMWHDWRRGAELIGLMAGGTASLADAAGFPIRAREGALPLWHSGQGGEVARFYYGTGAGLAQAGLTQVLARKFLGQRPGRRGVLSSDAEASVRAQIEEWVRAQLDAGIAPDDVPDMFYLRRRMGTWAGPGHGCVEFVRDTTSPLWSWRLAADELGLPAAQRARETFHRELLQRLAPQLAQVPYERKRGLRQKLADAARRRARRRPESATHEPFAAILPEIRDTVLSQPDHPAWPLLDRTRVERLLSSDAAALDAMSRYYAWRLATVFGGLMTTVPRANPGRRSPAAPS